MRLPGFRVPPGRSVAFMVAVRLRLQDAECQAPRWPDTFRWSIGVRGTSKLCRDNTLQVRSYGPRVLHTRKVQQSMPCRSPGAPRRPAGTPSPRLLGDLARCAA